MKSNAEWKKWGEEDPLYAVATWKGKQRGSAQAWTDEEFYALGKSDWADFSRRWRDYGITLGHCVEIGCGAGRITRQLAGSFEKVTGLDVSAHQLDYARKHVDPEKVTFLETGGVKIPIPDGACDAAFSVHVFQHFESLDDALAVFRELHRVLKPGGSMMIHLPLYEFPDTKFSALFPPMMALAQRLSDWKASLDRIGGKLIMRRLRFNRKQLLQSLAQLGFTNVECRLFSVASDHSAHEFVFATKAAASAT